MRNHQQPRSRHQRHCCVNDRLLATIILLLGVVSSWPVAMRAQAPTKTPDKPAASDSAPAWMQRGLPGAGHAVLRPLAGDWRSEKTIYIAMGSADRPAVSRDLITRRRWIAGGRYLQDITEGPFAGGTYYRMGLLGYSTMDRRHEWVTVDATNANMMIYRGAPITDERAFSNSVGAVLDLSGTFTDQGLIGEETAGRAVGMRTVIRIESDDRHVMELYFTPPGRSEMLADRTVYTRIKN